jgi:hypothetical protein
MAKKQYSPDQFGWDLTQHVCRICFGRIIHRYTVEQVHVHRCTNCGVETRSEHDTVHALCACGIKLRSKKDAGIRCVANTNKCPEQPAEIVAVQVEPEFLVRK